MKKCPFRLDDRNQVAYALKVGKDVYGPYATETSARKAAGRAGIKADILRLEVAVTSKPAGTYNP